ncbi:MAG: hypothetical protein JO142_17570 [Burkholderiales bacterium]|nr:hypothetical protein [Burkholderiales bacterium]
MVYAINFDTHIVIGFQSERLAAEHCRQHEGNWQCVDETGRLVYIPGVQSRVGMGLLAAHQWLADHHDVSAWYGVVDPTHALHSWPHMGHHGLGGLF